jgi:small subunit ribosomal protein S21
MIIVPIEGKMSIDQALKKHKLKFSKLKINEELRERQYYKKGSVKKRDQKKKAIYLENKRREEGDF